MSVDALIAVGLVAPVGAFFAIVLWMARMPGDPAGARSPRATAAITGGIIAGVLMGPMVLGRIAPEFHRDAFVGTTEQVRAFDRMLAEQRGERTALLATGVSEVALDEMRVRHAAAAEDQRAAIDAAARTHRRALLVWGLLPLTAVMGLGFGLAFGGVASSRRGGKKPRMRVSAALRQALLIALGFVLVTLIARLFVDQWWAAAMFAGGMSVVGIPVVVGRGRGRDRRGWAVSLAGNAIAMATLAVGGIIGVVVGWLGGGAIARLSGQPAARGLRRIGAMAAFAIALPAAIALSLATIDPGTLLTDRSFVWLALLAFLIGGDFRWAGIALGRPNGVGRWREAAHQIDHGTGALQAVAAASVALLGPVLEVQHSASVAAALLIGAVTIELGKPIRHGMARSLDGSVEDMR